MNMPIDAYHAAVGLSSSGVKHIIKSPHHYIDRNRNPHLYPARDYWDLGDAVHAFLIEPARFNSQFIVQPESIKRRAGKQWDAFARANSDKRILTGKQIDALLRIKHNVFKRESFVKRMKGGDVEVSFFWIDPATGCPLKARVDKVKRITIDGVDYYAIFELKTAFDASYSEWCRKVVTMGYDVQCYLQVQAVRILCEVPIDRIRFWWGIVETEPPYLPVTYSISPDILERGERVLRYAATLYKQCLDQSDWPGYPEETPPVSTPTWAKNRLA